MLTLSAQRHILQASANLGDWTGFAAGSAAGQQLAAVIRAAAAERLAPELHALPRIHLIRDANDTPVALMPSINPVTGAANDLSCAALRSGSPVHLQYLRNMGTMASMAVSLMVRGELWGLVSRSKRVPPANSWARSWRCASNRAKTRASCSSGSRCAA
jgi:hypothetical protein